MFKKPKRNFRGRRKDSESGDENTNNTESANLGGDENFSLTLSEIKKSKKKKKEKADKPANSVLSFGDDEHEGI